MLEVHEPREVVLPEQFHVTDRPITLLGDDDLGLPADPLPILVVGLVVLLAVDEHHHVGVLFDGAGFAKVIEPGPVVARHLRLPVELRQAEHRDVEFAGHPLQPPRDPRHLLLTWIPRIVRLDQLEVVDHDHRQPLLPLEPAGHRGDFGERAARCVVDEQRRRPDLGRLLHEAAPVFLRDRAVAEPVAVDLGGGAEQSVGEFEGRHFEAHKQHGLLEIDRRMLRDIHREGRLAHTWAGRQDHQFRVVKAAAELVEVGEARLHAADRVLVLHAGVHPHHHLFKHRLDRLRLCRTAAFENREDLFFSAGQQLPGFVRRVVGVAENVGAGINERAQQRLVANDCGVVRGVGSVWDGLHNVGESRCAADPFEVALGLEPLDDNGGVDSLPGVVKVEEVTIKKLVRLVGEILRPHDQRDVVAHVGLEQNAAEHGPFGVDVGRPVSRVEQRRCRRLTVAITARPASFAVSVAPAAVSRSSHRRASVREPPLVLIRLPTATPAQLRQGAT